MALWNLRALRVSVVKQDLCRCRSLSESQEVSQDAGLRHSSSFRTWHDSGTPYNFRQKPPKQLSPTPQELPQRPQFCESLRKVALLTHLPMHISEPGAHVQKPPVHVSENEHRLPQRPQLSESLTKPAVSTQRPLQYAWPAGQSKGDVPVPLGGAGRGRLAIACAGRLFDRVIAAATRSRSSDSGCCSTISTGDPTSRKKLWEFASMTSEATPPTAKPTMAPMAVLFRPLGLNVNPLTFVPFPPAA